MQNLQQLFAKIAHALKHSGYLCFSSFGPDNLKEIKALTGQGLDYFSLPELRRCLESQGFEIVYLSETVKTLAFEHPRQVLQRSEEHTSELQSRPHLVCRLLLEKKKILSRYSFHCFFV